MGYHLQSGLHMMLGGQKKVFKYGVVDTKQMCCMSTLKDNSIQQLPFR